MLYESFTGSLHGYVAGDVPTIRQAVTSSMDVLDVTEQTAVEAPDLQQELLSRGVPADNLDTLVAAHARGHGATFATAEKHFWKSEVQDILDVAEYDPY